MGFRVRCMFPLPLEGFSLKFGQCLSQCDALSSVHLGLHLSQSTRYGFQIMVTNRYVLVIHGCTCVWIAHCGNTFKWLNTRSTNTFLSATSHNNCVVARCLINIVYLAACAFIGMCLYRVMMTLHFLNDGANDAESTQIYKKYDHNRQFEEWNNG